MKLSYTYLILKTLQGRYSHVMNKKTDAEGLGTQHLHKAAEQWLEYSLLMSDMYYSR